LIAQELLTMRQFTELEKTTRVYRRYQIDILVVWSSAAMLRLRLRARKSRTVRGIIHEVREPRLQEPAS
jgi:hypothetical protein